MTAAARAVRSLHMALPSGRVCGLVIVVMLVAGLVADPPASARPSRTHGVRSAGSADTKLAVKGLAPTKKRYEQRVKRPRPKRAMNQGRLPPETPPAFEFDPDQNYTEPCEGCEALFLKREFLDHLMQIRPSTAWRRVGEVACKAGSVGLAMDAYRRLDASGRQFLLYICRRHGITDAFTASPRRPS